MRTVFFVLCLVVASTYAASENEDGLFARVEGLFKYLKGPGEDVTIGEVEVKCLELGLKFSMICTISLGIGKSYGK